MEGCRPHRPSRLDQSAGWLTTELGLGSGLNVEENIGFGVTVRDHKKATIDHLLESMQLEAFRKDYPH
ncbi:MAG: hypothetical protein AAF604_21125, partial [Acidobacteriota bacterium]